jgi:hypothetical protein
MANYTADKINELLILQKKMDAIYKECLAGSMTRPLLWVPHKGALDDLTLEKLNARVFPSYD